jgi:CRP-like cAMP-binding protein
MLSNSLHYRLDTTFGGNFAQIVLLDANTNLYPSERIDFVYFPQNALVSLMFETPHIAEAALIGNEGVVGSTVLLGVDRPIGSAVVVKSGAAARIPASGFCGAVDRDPGAKALLMSSLYDLLVRIGKLTACAFCHNIEQRCSRWLLRAHDCGGSELAITQQRLAQLLGIRRASISPALIRLRQEGAIKYSRGRLMIVNRKKLAAVACRCDQVGPIFQSTPIGPSSEATTLKSQFQVA